MVTPSTHYSVTPWGLQLSYVVLKFMSVSIRMDHLAHIQRGVEAEYLTRVAHAKLKRPASLLLLLACYIWLSSAGAWETLNA